MLTVIGLLKMRDLTRPEQGDAAMWAEHGEQYLQAWLAGVRKYVPQPHRVLVMTDSPTVVNRNLNDGEESVLLATHAPAFFAKLEMFRVRSGRCLYIDLDTVFCGDLSALCALPADPMVMMDDRNVPRLPNGSVILFDAGRCGGVWDAYQTDPEWHHQNYRNVGTDYSRAFDQAFIAEWLAHHHAYAPPLFQDMLPPDYCLNAFSELPNAENWSATRLIFGCGMKAKMHRMDHPAIRENWAGV